MSAWAELASWLRVAVGFSSLTSPPDVADEPWSRFVEAELPQRNFKFMSTNQNRNDVE